MNGYDRIMAAIRGQQPDRVPVMLHNFMMAMKEAGYSHGEYRKDPQKVADTFIQSVEKYEYDGVLVDIDTATLAGAVGVPVDYPEDEVARCHEGCISDLAAVPDLAPPDVEADGQIQVWLEAVRLLKAHFGDEICVRGNCDQAPFSLASMMRTPQMWMMDLMDEDNRHHVMALLDWCAEATSQFIRLMAESGADMLSNGDSPAGPAMISPAMYEQFAMPGEMKVIDESHALGLPYVLHICGDTTPILDRIVRTGADGLELDYKTDTQKAFDVLNDSVCFVGNIDPSGVLALGTVQDVERETAALLDIFTKTPRFILNAGCALPPDTPGENLQAMIRVARQY